MVNPGDFTECCGQGVERELDARGLRCPMPLLKAKQEMRGLGVGERLRVLATDAGSMRDFQAFALLSGQVLEAAIEESGIYCYILRKAH